MKTNLPLPAAVPVMAPTRGLPPRRPLGTPGLLKLLLTGLLFIVVGLPAAFAQTPEDKTANVGNNPTLIYFIPSFSVAGTPAAARYQFISVPTTGLIQYRSGVLADGGFVNAAANTIINPAQAATLAYNPANNANNTGTFTFRYSANSQAALGTFVGNALYTINVAVRSDDQTAVIMPNTNGQTAIPALTVSSTITPNRYRIFTFPSASQGRLFVNGTQVTAARDVSVAEASQITFDPEPGFAGNAFFTYAAASGTGAFGTTARYSLPVSKAACGVTSGLDFSRRTAGEDFKATTVTIGGTTVTTSGYTTSVTGTNTNVFAIGNNANLPGPALVWQVNNVGNNPTTTPNVSSVTYTFNRPVSNLSLAISDIDRDITTANFIDEVEFNGFATAGSTTPIVLSASDVATAAGINEFAAPNTVRGTSTSVSDPAATVVVTFPSPVQRITLLYRNTATFVDATTDRGQTVGIPSLIFCAQADAFTLFNSGNTSATPNSLVNYSVSFGNNGADDAINATRTVTLPVGSTGVVVPTGTTYNAGTRVIDFGTATAANGDLSSFNFSFNAPATPGTYSVVANTGSLSEDNNSANNIATRTLIVSDCNVTATLNYAAALPAGTAVTGIRRGAINGGPASQGPNTDAGTDGITVSYRDYTSTFAANQNDLYVGTSGATVGTSLVWQVNNNNSNDVATVTLLLSRPVDNFSFNLLDIDENLNPQNFTDLLTFDGFPTATGGTAVALAQANFTLGAANSFVGNNTVEGIGNSATTETRGNLTVRFPGPVQRIVLTYRNLSTVANNRTQTFGISTLTYCSPADVTTTITAATTPVFGGAPGQFNVTFVNSGPNAAANVTRQVQLIPGLVNVVASGGGNYDGISGIVTYPSTAILANGANLNSTITFTTPLTGTVTATSTVGTTSSEGGSVANNAANANIVTIPVADLTTALTGPASVTPGQATGNYTATFTNEGPTAASAVTQRVTLPAGATNVVVNGISVATPAGGVIDFGTATSLAIGATNSFTFSFTPATTATGTLNVTSNVTTTGASQGNNIAPDASTLAVTVVPTANVSAAIVATTTTVAAGTLATAGTAATFTATFNNSGPATAAGVVATVQLPRNLTNVTATNGGVYNATTGVITYAALTSIANGTPTTSVIKFDAPANGPIVALASVSTTTSELGQTANNQATAAMVVTPTFDLTTSLTGPASAVTGDLVTLAVTTTNNGLSGVTNAVQTVQLTSGLTNVYVSNGGVYNPATTTQSIVSNGVTYSVPAGGVVFPTIASLPAGQTVANSVSFSQPATAFAPSALVTPNTTGAGESNTANNTAFLNGNGSSTALTVATPAAGIANAYTNISSSVASTTVGSPITLTVVTGNNGPSQATGVTQTVQLLPGLATAGLSVNGSTATTTAGNVTTFTAAGANGAQYNNVTGILTFATLTNGTAGSTSGSSVSNTIAFNAPATVGNNGQILAMAAVSTTNTDPVAADNVSSTAVTLVPRTDLATAITGPATAVAGQSVEYTAVFSNNGPMNATGVTGTAQLPAGLGTVTVTDGAGTAVAATYNATTGQLVLPVQTTLAAGASQVFRITFAAPAVNMTVRSNVGSTSSDAIAANNSASAPTTVQGSADLATTVSGPATAPVGSPVTYSVLTANNGTTLAPSAVTTLQLATGFTATTLRVNGLTGTAAGSDVTFTDGSSYNSTTGLVTFPTVASLASGASAANYVTFIMPTNPTNGQVIGTSSVSSAASDPVVKNNASAVATSVAPATPATADLTAAVTASAASVAAGANVTFTATYTNTAGSTATNVRPTLQLQAGLGVAGIQVAGQSGTLSNGIITFPNGATYNSTNGLVTFPTIASQLVGGSVSYAVQVTAPNTGPLTAVAATSSDTSEPTTAAAQNNNVAATTVNTTPTFDVTTSLAGPVSAVVGSSQTYTVTATNNGPQPTGSATTQTVTVPAGQTPTNISNGGVYSNATNTITWTIPAGQAAGSNGAVANGFTITQPAGGASLAATVSATGDSNAGNNTAFLNGATALTATIVANQPPLAFAVVNNRQSATGTTNNPMGNTVANNPATPTGLLISPLVATDPENALSSTAPFTVTSLPTAAQGVLYYDNAGTYVPVAANQTLTATQATTLRFLPNTAFAGNASFTYRSTDAAANQSPVVTYTIPVAQDLSTTYAIYNSGKGGSNRYTNGDVLAQTIDPNTAQYTSAGLVYNATTGVLLSGAANGLPTTGTNAVLASGSTLPAGISLDPATGRIFISNAALITNMRTAQSYTVSVQTTDINGGTNTVPVTFTLGAFPLPVELTDFTAQAVQNVDALLKWQTASEQNNDYFDVERSLTGTEFVKIGRVQGQGNATRVTSYALTDAGIGRTANGLVYYRLRQVDVDGTSSYSPVRTVSFANSGKPTLSLFPNPAASGTQLDLTQLPAGSYQVSLLDGTGRVVLGTVLDAGLTHALNLNTIASGTYTVLVRGQGSNQAVVIAKRLIKE